MADSFRTIFPEFSYPFRMGYDDSVFCMGSCFAVTISEKLEEAGYHVTGSPFGIVFNPLSMASQLRMVLDNHEILMTDLVLDQGMYHSFDHHGSYSGEDPHITLSLLNTQLNTAWNFFKTASRVILTFGSAHYYVHRASGKVVANCHKIPQSHFEKRMASVQEMQKAMNEVILMMLEQNPRLEILVSVSPVRYLRDGFVENSRSKAALIQLASELCRAHPAVHYFPAYEIFMDDLRDYRFTAEDLVHPSHQAIRYIWNYFSHALFDAGTRVLQERVLEIRRMKAHRPLYPGTAAARKSEEILRQKMLELQHHHPEVALRLR